ncbi:hypothetical protein DS831_04530 [Bombilactobacillus bombi]|uniref:Uncharacterized protein n=1 Tax=Bombilactobacillus bombi TaxID=1303590 RepID=A0A417ZHV5_9LACO|nr:hypothetical protein [Bombilactobacillus bombi]RHW51292.1 hypothetical protein DS831_04530 [Bombilactobacillus bombi]
MFEGLHEQILKAGHTKQLIDLRNNILCQTAAGYKSATADTELRLTTDEEVQLNNEGIYVNYDGYEYKFTWGD